MLRLGYFVSKVKRAWSDGTLWEKASRSLITTVMRPFQVMIGYVRLSRADRNVNIKSGFADHRQQKYHRRSNTEHLRRIIAAYKASKQAQQQATLPFQIRGLWAEWITVNHKK